jgi:hypothetical protein
VNKPVNLIADDDEEVLAAMRRDIRALGGALRSAQARDGGAEVRASPAESTSLTSVTRWPIISAADAISP